MDGGKRIQKTDRGRGRICSPINFDFHSFGETLPADPVVRRKLWNNGMASWYLCWAINGKVIKLEQCTNRGGELKYCKWEEEIIRGKQFEIEYIYKGKRSEDGWEENHVDGNLGDYFNASVVETEFRHIPMLGEGNFWSISINIIEMIRRSFGGDLIVLCLVHDFSKIYKSIICEENFFERLIIL